MNLILQAEIRKPPAPDFPYLARTIRLNDAAFRLSVLSCSG